MKKYILLTVLALAGSILAAQAQTITTTFQFSAITSANLAATITTATTETAIPSGATLRSLNVFRVSSGSYNITATYQ